MVSRGYFIKGKGFIPMKKTAGFVIIAVLFCAFSTAMAAGLFGGYSGTKWGADLHAVMKTYPKGEIATMGNQLLYKQTAPNKEMKQRTFAFRDNRLSAVSVTFNPKYVKKAGIENLLKKHKKAYGDGALDNSSAPHMVSYRWEDAGTSVTFAYAPKRADMTVLMYEKK